MTQFDAIATACPTCTAAIKLHYPELLSDDTVLERQARAVAGRTFDISEYLIDRITVPQSMSRKDTG